MLRKLFAVLSSVFALAVSPAVAGTSAAISVNPASLTHSFSSSTTDTVPSWASGVFVTMMGAGGGGNASTLGGNAGQMVTDFFSPVTPGATLTITVGTGGTGGASPTTGGSSTVTGTILIIPTACGGAGAGGSGCAGVSATIVNSWGTNAYLAGAAPYSKVQPQPGSSSTAPWCMYDDTISSSLGACTIWGKSGVGYGAGGNDTSAGGRPGYVVLKYVQ